MRRDQVLPFLSASRKFCSREGTANNTQGSCYLNTGKEGVSRVAGLDSKSSKHHCMKQQETSRCKHRCVLAQVWAPKLSHGLRTSKDFWSVQGLWCQLWQPSTSPSASEGEAVPDVGSAEAPQHQEKLVHNLGMSHGHIHEFYGSFTLPEYPKEMSVQVPLPQLAGLVPAQGERSLFGLPAYLRHNPHFCQLPKNKSRTPGTPEALQSHLHTHSVLCYQQQHFKLITGTRWPQREARVQQPLFSPFSKLSLESIIHTGHSLAGLNENRSMFRTCQKKLELSLHSISDTLPFLHGKSQNYHQAA